jgi:hypothetical protein
MSETARLVKRERKIRSMADQLFAEYAPMYPSLLPDAIRQMARAEATYLVTERDAIQMEDSCDNEPR